LKLKLKTQALKRNATYAVEDIFISAPPLVSKVRLPETPVLGRGNSRMAVRRDK